jgi:hypothetical protein
VRKLLIFPAVLCIVLGPMILVTGLLPFTQKIYEPLLCPEGSEIGTDTATQTDLRGTVTAFYLVCTGPDGKRDDVTGKLFIGLCGAPLIGGLLLVLGLSGGGKQPTPTTYVTTGTPIDTISPSPRPRVSGGSSLSDRLRELEAAYDEGLLTRDEYEEQKQRLLDNM